VPFITYERKNFRAGSLDIIAKARQICEEYAAQGLTLSLRQLYYQFVSRDWIPNKQSEYKRLGDIISDARMAGMLDWLWLEDRGRSVTELSHWESADSILRAAASGYQNDKWKSQPKYVMVMVEKDALTGVFEGICQELDIPLFACKGYPSSSALWQIAYRRIAPARRRGQEPVILHFGDHDPSGIQMTEDLQGRLSTLSQGFVTVNRIALTMDQIQQYSPPPNPAKETDSRFESYRAEYGDESWELDALRPEILVDLVRQNVLALRDDEAWKTSLDSERDDIAALNTIADKWGQISDVITNRWGEVSDFLDGLDDEGDEE
jgi:hypothetical protein